MIFRHMVGIRFYSIQKLIFPILFFLLLLRLLMILLYNSLLKYTMISFFSLITLHILFKITHPSLFSLINCAQIFLFMFFDLLKYICTHFIAPWYQYSLLLYFLSLLHLLYYLEFVFLRFYLMNKFFASPFILLLILFKLLYLLFSPL